MCLPRMLYRLSSLLGPGTSHVPSGYFPRPSLLAFSASSFCIQPVVGQLPCRLHPPVGVHRDKDRPLLCLYPPSHVVARLHHRILEMRAQLPKRLNSAILVVSRFSAKRILGLSGFSATALPRASQTACLGRNWRALVLKHGTLSRCPGGAPHWGGLH